MSGVLYTRNGKERAKIKVQRLLRVKTKGEGTTTRRGRKATINTRKGRKATTSMG